MNHEKLKEYFQISLQRDRTSDECLYDALTDKLDRIWYDDLSYEDHAYINQTLERHGIRREDTTIEEVIEKIITTLQEKPTMTNVFRTKEDYLTLRTFWKQFYAEGKHKPVPVEYNTGHYDSETRSWKKAYHMVSPLTRDSHLVYLAAMGRSLDKALGNASPETITEIKGNLKYRGDDYWFSLFGEALDAEYHDVVLQRLRDYFESK